MKIPLYKAYVGPEERKGIFRVLHSRKLARGSEVAAFEKEFAKYVGKKYAIAVNSGTSALHILVRSMGWKKGDEVITTPFSYIASSNCLLFEGITPVFVDIDPLTLNIDPKKIEEKMTSRTRGILLVHALGLPVENAGIKKLARKYNLTVIEDACEALAGKKDALGVGNFSAAVYGFHENKQLTTAGEGGIIATNNPQIAKMCGAMRDQGRSLKKDWIKHVILGFNFRMTELQAAFGRAQLRNIHKTIAKREAVAKRYSDLLREVPNIGLPQKMTDKKRSWFVYFIILDSFSTRNRICRALSRNKIAFSTNYFPPIYNFPMYKNYKKGYFPNTEKASQSLLVLPTFYEIKDGEILRVTHVIKKSLKTLK